MTTLSFVGDISLGEHYFSFGHGPRSLIENNRDIFEHVSVLFSGSDYLIGNLEGPISDLQFDKNSPHSRVFRGSPKSAKVLKNAGFNVINIANNHSIQHGIAALEQSVSLLEAEGITVIGLREHPIIFLDATDTSIAVIGCSLVQDNTNIDQKIYYSPTVAELILAVTHAKEKVAHVVVYIHWGIEGTATPSEEQEDLVQQLQTVGANIIVGHHSHSLQPIHISNKGVVAYSLGNFVFDLPWGKKNRESGILEVSINHQEIEVSNFKDVTIANSGQPLPTGNVTRLKNGINSTSKLSPDYKERDVSDKFLFFISNILRGDSLVKMRFLTWKILKKLRL